MMKNKKYKWKKKFVVLPRSKINTKITNYDEYNPFAELTV